MSRRLRDAVQKQDGKEIRSAVADELRAEGYLSDGEPSDEKSFADALSRFQMAFGLDADGMLNDRTLEYLQMPRCGSEEFFGLEAVAVGWPRRDLTFGFLNECPTLTPAERRTATVAAFAEWSGAVNLHFTEGTSAASSDIKIGWFLGEHGEGLAFLRFDGKGGEFGHGFGPGSPMRPGEVHMDRAETWTVGAFHQGNADLLTVVLHEIGHALGLQHIPDNAAVMFRRFPLNATKRTLTATDIAAIRGLYP